MCRFSTSNGSLFSFFFSYNALNAKEADSYTYFLLVDIFAVCEDSCPFHESSVLRVELTTFLAKSIRSVRSLGFGGTFRVFARRVSMLVPDLDFEGILGSVGCRIRWTLVNRSSE